MIAMDMHVEISWKETLGVVNLGIMWTSSIQVLRIEESRMGLHYSRY